VSLHRSGQEKRFVTECRYGLKIVRYENDRHTVPLELLHTIDASLLERHVTDGKHFIEFKNAEPNLDGHLMQGFPIDGRKVPQLEVSGWVKTENVVGGEDPDQIPNIVITLLDDQRKIFARLDIGPFRGTSTWREERKTFLIPKDAREGILRIGLFGATGTACFDKLEIKKVQH